MWITGAIAVDNPGPAWRSADIVRRYVDSPRAVGRVPGLQRATSPDRDHGPSPAARPVTPSCRVLLHAVHTIHAPTTITIPREGKVLRISLSITSLADRSFLVNGGTPPAGALIEWHR
jgi:hypothetical protein